jgi:hypothetical protein
MPFRKRNLKFADDDIAKTRELLRLSVSGWSGPATIEALYSAVEACFLSGGSGGSLRTEEERSTTPASWWRSVPQEERALVQQLEAEAKYIFDQWNADRSSISVSEVVRLRRHANAESTRIRRAADGAIQREMGSDFPDQALCWKILKKIRRPVESVVIDVGTLTAHFTNVFHRKDRPIFVVENPVDGWGVTKLGEKYLDAPFTDDELVKALKALNGTAATGPELVPSSAIKEVFKDSSARVPLLSLVNLCWSEGRIPKCWGGNGTFYSL